MLFQSNDYDQGTTGSPDPEEEEGQNEGGKTRQQGETTKGQDTEAWVQKVRTGWTLADVGGITVGELYLMVSVWSVSCLDDDDDWLSGFIECPWRERVVAIVLYIYMQFYFLQLGQNKKICLEYEFEDAAGKMKDSSTENCCSSNNNDDITNNNSKNTSNSNTISTNSNISTTTSNINTNSIHIINTTNTIMDVGGGIEIKVGHVNGICRPGEGESGSKAVDSHPGVSDSGEVMNSGAGDGGTTLMLVPSTGPSLDVSGVGTSTTVAGSTDGSQQAKGRDGSWDAMKGEVQVEKSEEEEKKKAVVENLSGMLAQLLSMAKAMMAKSSGESLCPCGHVCGRAGNLLRSPAGGRGQGPGGLGRSPGSSRSPRTGRLSAAAAAAAAAAVTTTQSSGLASPGPTSASSRSPLAAPRPLRERNKPTSAKRLITDNMEHHSNTVSLFHLSPALQFVYVSVFHYHIEKYD